MPANKREIISSFDKIETDRGYDPVVSVRIPQEILDVLETWVDEAKEKGKRVNRSTLIVKLLRDALRLSHSKE